MADALYWFNPDTGYIRKYEPPETGRLHAVEHETYEGACEDARQYYQREIDRLQALLQEARVHLMKAATHKMRVV